MVCVGLQCSGMTSRGKFGGPLGGPGKIFGGQWPPWHPPSSAPVEDAFLQGRQMQTGMIKAQSNTALIF